MAFMTLRLAAPGVKVLQTPTQLPANIVKSQNIRWRGGLPEKLGGWQKYYNFLITGITREMWAWSDLDSVNHVALGGTMGVKTITGNNQTDLTPLFNIRVIPPANFDFTASSSALQINDVGSNATLYESVTLQAPIAGGGIVVYPGNYRIFSVASPDQYTINIGPQLPTVTGPGTQTATFTSTAGEPLITVTLPNHGLAVGQNFSIVLPTPLFGGNQTLSGFFEVLPTPAPTANTFTIAAQFLADQSGTVDYGNLGGDIQLTQWVVVTQQPLFGGWGDGPWGGPGAFSATASYPINAYVTESGTLYQALVAISPGAFNPAQWTAQPAGFVVTAWGQSQAPPPITGTPLAAVDWDLENWGSQLIIHPQDGQLFFWDPTSGIASAQPIAAGPVAGHGFFIAMPQQMIVVFGASVEGIQDPMLVAWCDAGNYSVWTAGVNNQAGTYRLTRGSKIIGGIQGPLQAILWTDVGMWLMQFTGYPLVWGFFEIARGCGLISKKACGVVGQVVYWMSRDGFWMYAGTGAQRLPCDVWDVIFKNLTPNLLWQANIRCAANTGFDEVSWYFPSQASTTGENDTQVKYNVVTGEWDYTQLPITQTVTEWIDVNIFGHPFSCMIDSTGANTLVMQHEMTPDAASAPLRYSVTTGYFQLAEGQQWVFVDYVLPDFKWKRWQQPQSVSAQVQLTFFVQDYPDDDRKPPIQFGPYFVNNETDAIDLRARGRYFSFTVAGNDLGSFVRLGGLKFRFAPDGRN
jgi:hypothetical protein